MSDVNFSFFKGAYPDMTTKNAYGVLGYPDERIKIEDEDEPGDDLYYFTKEGRILLHASDYNNTIGLIEFRPKIKLYLKDIFRNKINVNEKKISFYCDDDFKFDIYLNENDNSINEIYWWFK